MLTGHGYFNLFLKRIGRAQTTVGYHCGTSGVDYGEEDSASHTLLHCIAFERDRNELVNRIGHFDPGDLIARMQGGSLDSWKAVVRFAETVLTAKEVAEQERQALRGIAPSCYTKRTGRARIQWRIVRE